MQQKSKKLIIMVVGGVFGACLVYFESIWAILPRIFFQIFGLPGQLGLLISDTMIIPHMSRDGIPIYVIGWTGLYVGMIVGYGLIFLLVYVLMRYVKTRIM